MCTYVYGCACDGQRTTWRSGCCPYTMCPSNQTQCTSLADIEPTLPTEPAPQSRLFIFLLLSYQFLKVVCVLAISSLADEGFAIIFSQSMGCISFQLHSFCGESFKFDVILLVWVCLCFQCFGVEVNEWKGYFVSVVHAFF